MTTKDRTTGTLRRWMGISMIAVLAFGALAGGAAAHDPKPPHSAHGEITYLDDPDGEATRELSCQFWVKGDNVTHPDGAIRVAHAHPDEDARFGRTSSHSHTIGEWEAEPDGNGSYEFLAGPFQLHETADDVAVDLEMNASGFHESSDSAGFEYEACENPDDHDPPPPPHCVENVDANVQEDGDVALNWTPAERAETYRVFRVGGQAGPDELGAFATRTVAVVDTTSYVDEETEDGTEYKYKIIAQDGPRDAECGRATVELTTPEEGPPEPPACPLGNEANSRNDGSIRMVWQGVIDADTYNVYRATGDGEFELVAETDFHNYHDESTEPGTTYRYKVTAVNEHGESDVEECPVLEATAIPFFQSPALVAMAALGSLGAVGAVQTRRG